MDEAIARHCEELDRCNQRGSRMLSVFDLLADHSLDLDLAAWLLHRMGAGDSLMVGASAGGAGKTAVMCALLNLCPPGMKLHAATMNTIGRARKLAQGDQRCFICHEVSDGCWFAYLWAHDLREYCALSEAGHMLATTVHAETPAAAHALICAENKVPEARFNAFNLLIFLDFEVDFGQAKRAIGRIYYSPDGGPHRLVYDRAAGLCGYEAHIAPEALAAGRDYLEAAFIDGVRTIEASRERLLAHWG